MKKLIFILIILFSFISINEISAQVYSLTNDKSSAKIDNTDGVIKFRNNRAIQGMPDTIGGRVEFLDNSMSNYQVIPNVTYFQLYILGQTQSIVDSLWNASSTKPLVVRDTLKIDNKAYVRLDTAGIDTKSTVINTARVVGKNDLKLAGDANSQDVVGNGEFHNLNLDNVRGADVREGGGFRVTKKLELTRGELRNDTANNFTMSDSSLIVRHVGASLQHEPVFERSVSVKYVGTGSLVAGGEIPTDSSVLQTLLVQNTGGVTLTKNTTVNDSLFIGSNIYTEPGNDTVPKYILTLASEKNPVFDAVYAEIGRAHV